MLEDLKEMYPDSIIFDGYNEAIIGVDYREEKIIYSYNKIIEILKEDMSEEDAIEYFDFNIGCLYCGIKTPIILLEI